ncbi:TPA: radical SAM protein [Streptococcus pyogenes]|nr:radical SAM protein [Streptococcus pyogenes]
MKTLKYIFQKFIGIKDDGNKVVITNKRNGEWIKLSLNAFIIFQDIMQEKISFNNLKEKDRQFFQSLLKKLEKIGAIRLEKTCESESNNQSYNTRPLVTFSVCDRCNLNCKHCSYAKNFNKNQESDINNIISIIDEILKINPKMISITGGEPLMRKDFYLIFDYLRKNFLGELVLMTNGTLINENNIDIITKTFNSIDMSIDGINEDTCSQIRGKGVFLKVINSIKLLQKYDYNNISLSMVLTGNNYIYRDSFYDLCKKLEVKAITREFIPMGNGDENYEELNLSKEILIDDFNNEKIKAISEKKIDPTYIKCTSCKAGFVELFINESGDVYPCPLLVDDKLYMGNIIKKTINLDKYIKEKKFINSSIAKRIENSKPEKCKSCLIEDFCWKCPAYLYNTVNDEVYFNQMCSYNKKYLEPIIWR